MTERFDQSEREKNLGFLHLSVRPLNGLHKAGIYRIGELVDIASFGFLAPGLGAGSIAEIRQVLQSLVAAREDDGRVDWLKYSISRQFLILPERECAGFSGLRLMREFPRLCLAAARSIGGRLDTVIFEQSVLNNIPTRVLGLTLGMTHQGITMRREKVLKMVRGAVLDDEYQSCPFFFRQPIVTPLRKMRDSLRSRGKGALAHQEWKRIVMRTWQVSSVDDVQFENLLFEILGYQLVHPVPPQRKAIVILEGRKVEPLRRAFVRAARLMKGEFRRGISVKQLQDELRRTEGESVPGRAEIPSLFSAVFPVTEAVPGGGRRARIGDLVRMTDQLERILLEEGTPTHFNTLAKILNRHNKTKGVLRTGRHVSSALSGDRRFTAITRSGLWALKEWKEVETRSVVDIAADILRQESGPMTEAQLFERISTLRSVSRGSIGSLLVKNPRFRRTEPTVWDLK
ncbi:MAG: hypothetical protein H0U23_16180 [Blastocatellia bacterium]|nr:hypothetical protein [Blastocatellia bacterium]